jgi:hypothetical protein
MLTFCNECNSNAWWGCIFCAYKLLHGWCTRLPLTACLLNKQHEQPAEQVDLEVEDFHWVPKRCLDLAISTLGRGAPRLPAAPVLSLLTRLNKVWRAREAAALRRAKAAHAEEMAAFALAVTGGTPYQQSVAQQKLDFTKRQLKLSSAALGCLHCMRGCNRFAMQPLCICGSCASEADTLDEHSLLVTGIPQASNLGVMRSRTAAMLAVSSVVADNIKRRVCAGSKVKALSKYRVKVAEHLQSDSHDLLAWSMHQLKQVHSQRGAAGCGAAHTRRAGSKRAGTFSKRGSLQQREGRGGEGKADCTDSLQEVFSELATWQETDAVVQSSRLLSAFPAMDHNLQA